MQEVGNDLAIRDFDSKTDESFLFSSWIKSSKTSPTELLLDRRERWYHKHAEIEECLSNPQTVIFVLTLSEDPNEILGWICFRDSQPVLIHYVYIKELYRGRKLASLMLNSATQDWRTRIYTTSVPSSYWIKRIKQKNIAITRYYHE